MSVSSSARDSDPSMSDSVCWYQSATNRVAVCICVTVTLSQVISECVGQSPECTCVRECRCQCVCEMVIQRLYQTVCVCPCAFVSE